MEELKRRNQKKEIGKLEKGVTIAYHVKNMYQQTEDKAVHSVYAEENSPTEYAAELLERGEEKAVHVGNIAGQKAAEIYYKKKRLRKAGKEKVIKRIPPVVYEKEGSIRTSSKSVAKVSEPVGINCTEKKSGKRINIGPKQFWQKRKQKEMITKNSYHAIGEIGNRIILFLRSSLRIVLKAAQDLFLSLGIGGTLLVGLLIIVLMTASTVMIFGDGVNVGYTPVSAEVEQYDTLIRLYAREYDMTDYVDLVKAVMMQESAGKGKDPMQASECGFNTKYPRVPGGITEPEYSIQCGMQALKLALKKAEVESPVDMQRIKLALQSYNFGNRYLTWAMEKDGGYTHANAIEFSEKMKKKLGWERYGDTEYVPHVLRYYPFTGIVSGSGNSDIVKVAENQLGNVGGKPYWKWYGFNSRVEWCACFVSWCANECGYIEDGTVLKFSYCQTGANWFKKNKRWQSRYYKPVAGDIIFFDWEGDGHTDHVGIVEKCENGKVYTIEGNSGDRVRRRAYGVGSKVVYGYGLIYYDGSIYGKCNSYSANYLAKLVLKDNISVAEMAKEIDTYYNSLYRWINEYEECGESTFPGYGSALYSCQHKNNER